jgi:hypothetical protein
VSFSLTLGSPVTVSCIITSTAHCHVQYIISEGFRLNIPQFCPCRYVHMTRSVSSSSDDSLSADSYLNVLYLPSFNKQDRSRRSSEDSADSHQAPTLQGNVEECPQSHLDDLRYEESVYYLQEVNCSLTHQIDSLMILFNFP